VQLEFSILTCIAIANTAVMMLLSHSVYPVMYHIYIIIYFHTTGGLLLCYFQTRENNSLIYNAMINYKILWSQQNLCGCYGLYQ